MGNDREYWWIDLWENIEDGLKKFCNIVLNGGLGDFNFRRFLSIFQYTWIGGGQNLERRNVERPILRIFKTTNMEIMKYELFDSFIFEFIFSLFINYLHNLIIFSLENMDFPNGKINYF